MTNRREMSREVPGFSLLVPGRTFPGTGDSARNEERPTHKGLKSGAAADELEFMDVWYPIQVKQKDRLGRPDVDSFEAIMTRHDRTKGLLVAFDYSADALTEIGAFFRKSGKVIVALTVREILDEEIARKLA